MMPSLEVMPLVAQENEKKGEDGSDLGYYSGLEFENVDADLEKSIRDSDLDLEEEIIYGQDHLFQPFDFFTQRKTKRFFREEI